MLTLVYFARYREALGKDQEQIELAGGIETVGQLIDRLVAERGAEWEAVLKAPNLLVAVNQEMVDSQQTIQDGDEIAFFPPVTGG